MSLRGSGLSRGLTDQVRKLFPIISNSCARSAQVELTYVPRRSTHDTHTAELSDGGDRVDTVSASDLGSNETNVLAALNIESHVGVLLGAGASAAAGLPGWDEFATNLLVVSGSITDKATAQAFLEGQDPAIAAESARRAAGSRWAEVLRESLYGPPGEEAVAPSGLHEAAAALVAQRPPGDSLILTLNFDLLLENSLRAVLDELGSPVQVTTRSSDRPRAASDDIEVHHLHGSLTESGEGADSVVLTLSDYNSIAQVPRPWQVAILQEALQRGPLILAGTSYRDPDIRQWIHELVSQDSSAAVVVFLAREGLGLNRERFLEVQAALTAQWSALGVTVLPVQDHADAAQALRELPRVHDAGYIPPAERAARLFARHLDDFDRLQQEHAAELDADLQRLRTTFPGLGNLTLWLADGGGRLVRWAANDRIYRLREHLRAIQPGHDSEWIAGQSLGRNDQLARDIRHPASTARWRSVIATPVVTDLPGGPPFPSAVISAASTGSLADIEADSLAEEHSALSAKWATELERIASEALPEGSHS